MISNAMKVGTFWGIPLKIHWTFGLLMLFVAYSAFTNNFQTWQSFGFIGLILILFFCVILHEYGHALAAKKLGVKTQDIIVSPIGGVARLTNIPEKPKQELLIAIAGPLVNLIICALVGFGLYLYDGHMMPQVVDLRFSKPIELVRYIVSMNLALFLFNLIPAFPMDGGRILRALLASGMGHFRATKVATAIGRVLAVLFIFIGIFSQNLVLSMIGLIIFIMAGQEYSQSKFTHLFKSTPASKVMRYQFTKLHVNDQYHKVIDIYHSGKEKNFVVYDSIGNIVGAVPEVFIKDVIKNKEEARSIIELMSQKIVSIPETMSIKNVAQLMNEQGLAIVTVYAYDKIIGVIDRTDIEAYLETNS
jgi:Zn-dependent protease